MAILNAAVVAACRRYTLLESQGNAVASAGFVMVVLAALPLVIFKIVVILAYILGIGWMLNQ